MSEQPAASRCGRQLLPHIIPAALSSASGALEPSPRRLFTAPPRLPLPLPLLPLAAPLGTVSRWRLLSSLLTPSKRQLRVSFP
ncbi:uncharacterized protein V6R79_017811 [Siganus canaliculatus]